MFSYRVRLLMLLIRSDLPRELLIARRSPSRTRRWRLLLTRTVSGAGVVAPAPQTLWQGEEPSLEGSLQRQERYADVT